MLLGQPVTKDNHQLNTSGAAANAVRDAITYHPPSPGSPDHYADYQKILTSCTNQGGHLDALDCVVPPPPPPPPVVPVARVAVIPSGSCGQWLAAAGVTDLSNAMLIINHESGCNPYAKEPVTGACGVAQELPCGKSGCAFGDGACEVNWMFNTYIKGRYGTPAAAWAHEVNLGWY